MSALRIRRYLDDVLVDERYVEGPLGDMGSTDGDWAAGANDAGIPWRVVIDDPTGERLARAVVLEGGPT